MELLDIVNELQKELTEIKGRFKLELDFGDIIVFVKGEIIKSYTVEGDGYLEQRIAELVYQRLMIDEVEFQFPDFEMKLPDNYINRIEKEFKI